MKTFRKIDRKEIDEMSADPELLGYKITCYKCSKLPIKCKCDDKWFRLHSFKVKLSYARASVGLGGANPEERILVEKFWRFK